MGSTTLTRANAMPAPTWHRLKMNDVDIELPEGLAPADKAHIAVGAGASAPGDATGAGADAGEAGLGVTVSAAGAVRIGAEGDFEAALAQLQQRLDERRAGAPADTRAALRAAGEDVDPHDLDTPALSSYEKRAVLDQAAGDVAAAFECGMGKEADAFVARAAAADGGRVVLVCDSPASAFDAPARIDVRIAGGDGRLSAADVDVVAAPGAQVELGIAFDSPAGGAGVAACRLRVFAGANSRVRLSSIVTLDAGWTALDTSGYVLDERARVEATQRVLGAKESYTGLAADLRGDEADISIDTRYVGHASNAVDFNYIVRHRGRKTTCTLDANGVLLGSSRKVLRGTIDLVHGCKGSEGSERDTVLIADEGARNKTVPVILCDEDDVAGNHGATIGHVRSEQLYYLQSRGLTQDAAEGLFATAALEDAAAHARSAEERAGVERIASGLDVPFAPDEADEDEE